LDVERPAPAAAFVLIFARDDFARRELEGNRLGASLRDLGRRSRRISRGSDSKGSNEGNQRSLFTHDYFPYVWGGRGLAARSFARDCGSYTISQPCAAPLNAASTQSTSCAA